MEIKKDIIDKYYQYIEEKYCCKTLDELLGKKYFVDKQFGLGSFSRIKIEDGLDLSKANIDHNMDLRFYTKDFIGDMVELGYCYSGEMKVTLLPSNEKYKIKAGDISFHRIFNEAEYIDIQYSNCKYISISIDFKNLKNIVNPIWEEKIMDWENYINNICKENILVIEKGSYEIQKIAEDIDDIIVADILGYMKLKLKVMEFLSTFFEEKSNDMISKNLTENEMEIIIRAKEIINKNLQSLLSVKEIAKNLNISIYKLQEIFKSTTGSTVYEYIKKARIENAKYLLKNTDMSIIDIANEVGYDNPSKFANLFKRYNNITPLKYRKSE